MKKQAHNDQMQEERIMDFITHKGNAEILLQEIASVLDDHLGLAPEQVTDQNVWQMAGLVYRLTKIASDLGIDTEEAMNS